MKSNTIKPSQDKTVEKKKAAKDFLLNARRIREHNKKINKDINSYGSGYDQGYIDGINDLILELYPKLNGEII